MAPKTTHEPLRNSLRLKSNFLRQMKDQHNTEALRVTENKSTSSQERIVEKGFFGHAKGMKPARFNEDLEDKISQTLTSSNFHNSKAVPCNSKKLKISLRSINNAAERDNYRKL